MTSPAPGAGDQITHPDTRLVLARGGVSPKKLLCTNQVEWDPRLNKYAKKIVAGLMDRWKATPDAVDRKWAVHHALGYLVRTYFNHGQPHNLGAMLLKGLTYGAGSAKARPLLLFRSGLTIGATSPRACFESLVRHGQVRHVINLYGGLFPFGDVIASEKAAASRLGVSYFDASEHPELCWRSLVEHSQDYQQNRAQAAARLGSLIRDHVLRPRGEAPKGNIYIHCCGGMHRSGMLFGVLRRCINGDPMALIEEEYRRHTVFRSPREPGGFEPLNLRFIREFDCMSLKIPAKEGGP